MNTDSFSKLISGITLWVKGVCVCVSTFNFIIFFFLSVQILFNLPRFLNNLLGNACKKNRKRKNVGEYNFKSVNLLQLKKIGAKCIHFFF